MLKLSESSELLKLKQKYKINEIEKSMAHSTTALNPASNTLNRTNKEQIGCRVIRGADWKWGKQVKRI